MARPSVLPGGLAEVAALADRADALLGRVGVLVWISRVNSGGGARLLASLLPALARDPRIRFLRLAVPHGSLLTDEPIARGLVTAGIGVYPLGREATSAEHCAELLPRDALIDRIVGTEAWRTATIDRLAADCDVVFMPWPHGEPMPEIDAPIVCTVQDTTLLDYPEAGAGSHMAVLEGARTWVDGAAEVVVSSQATQDALVRLFGPQATRARVVGHAIRPTLGTAVAPAGTPEHDLPERYVICATNLAVQKNLDVLLHAWGRFESRREWPLVVIGHGTAALVDDVDEDSNWRERQLWGIAHRNGLHDGASLHALGYVPDDMVRPLIEHAAALVMPSTNEGGGSFPAEEALMAGTPLLCSDIPVMREHLQGRTAPVGWFDPLAPDSLLRAMRALVADHEARVESSRAARADPRPSWGDVAADYADMLARAAEGARCASCT